MMKRHRRYSNFHRARKYHRKMSNLLKPGVSVEQIPNLDKYITLYCRYKAKSLNRDLVSTEARLISGRLRFVLRRHHDVIPDFVKEWKTTFNSELFNENPTEIEKGATFWLDVMLLLPADSSTNDSV